MANKQTAVEWLKSQLESYGSPQFCKLNWDELDELSAQAKQMEEEQTKQFAKLCLDKALDLDVRTAYSNIEQYYNETYGKDIPNK